MSGPVDGGAKLVLSHRVRNAEGKWHWQPVASHDQIRVTKDRGKVLHMSVSSSVPFRSTDVGVFLVNNVRSGSSPTPADVVHPAIPNMQLAREGLTIQSISEPSKQQTGDYTSEVIAKINKISRQLQVIAIIATTLQPHPLIGLSVEFQTHDTGKLPTRSDYDPAHAHPPHQLKHILPQTIGHTAAHQQSPSNSSSPPGSSPSHSPPSNHSPALTTSPSSSLAHPTPSESQCPPSSHQPSNPQMQMVTTSSSSRAKPNSPKPNQNRKQGPYSVHQLSSLGDLMGGYDPKKAPSIDAQYLAIAQQHKLPAVPPAIQAYSLMGSVPSRIVMQRQQQPYSHQLGHYSAVETVPMKMAPPSMQQLTNREAFSKPITVPLPPQHQKLQGQARHGTSSAAREAYPSADYIANLMGESPGQYMQPDLSSSSSSASSTSGSYDSDDALLASKRRRTQNPRLRSPAGVRSNADDSDDDDDDDFHRHPEAVQYHPGGVTVHTGLHVKGIARAQAFLQYSDLRLKTSVEDIADAVDILSKLEGKRYKWKKDVPNSPLAQSGSVDEGDDIDRQIAYLKPYIDGETEEIPNKSKGETVLGLIAQEVQKVLPEIVQEDENGWLSVDYVEIVPILIEAFKEHMNDYHRTQDSFRKDFEEFKQQIAQKQQNDNQKTPNRNDNSGDSSPQNDKAESLSEEESSYADDSSDGTELDDFKERQVSELNFRSKPDIKDLADHMASLIPPRPYNELLHNLRTDKRKKKLKQRSYGIAFMSIATFFIVINAILAASIPVFVFHIGTTNSGTGMMLFDYAVNTERDYTVTVAGNQVSVLGRNWDSTSAQSVRAIPLLPESQTMKRSLERDLPLPPPDGKPNDEIMCHMIFNPNSSASSIFQSQFSWSVADPRGGRYSLNYTVEILYVLEYEETNGVPGYQTDDYELRYVNNLENVTNWKSWNVSDASPIKRWHTSTEDSMLFLRGGVSQRSMNDPQSGHNLTSNAIRLDILIGDFPFSSPTSFLAVVMRIRSNNPLTVVSQSLAFPMHADRDLTLPSSMPTQVMIDKSGDGNIRGNVLGTWNWSPTVLYGYNHIDARNLTIHNATRASVVASRLPSNHLFLDPYSTESIQVFSFAFWNSPQAPVYEWSTNVGVDDFL